jgi:tetratricopeptide (TPR) repeat protein
LTNENVEIGKSIVAKLEFLPLAIDQASAFISAQKLPLTLFLERFDLQKEEILKYTPSLTEYRRKLDDDEKETVLNVFTTWEPSFQQIHGDETGERLRSFLTTAAFFDTRDIGEDLFERANDLKTVPVWIDAFISEGELDRVRYRKALAELSKLSLLNLAIEDTKQCRFYLHPLVADWLRLRVGPERRRLYTIESCCLLAKLIKSTNVNFCGYAFRLYLRHIDECLNNKRMYLIKLVNEDIGFIDIFVYQFALLLKETSRYREGISLLEEALPIIESAHGEDHELALDIIHNLGLLYSSQGKFAEAEEMYKRALVGYEKALGKDHVSTLNTVYNMALLMEEQGQVRCSNELSWVTGTS